MEKKQWQEHASILKDIFGLTTSPVAIRCTKEKEEEPDVQKVRICRAILNAAAGASLKVCKENNACFGAGWHLGFHDMKDPKISGMVKKFVVEGEKLFVSYEALDTLVSQMKPVPSNKDACFMLEPMERAEEKPEIVIFVCNPEAACRLLTMVTFLDGNMPKIKIGGPTCRLAIMYPLLTGEVNISFYDFTARKMCNVEKDKLLVSIPYSKIPRIIESIDACSGGTAKIEFPPEFRAFLQKRLTK
ncbi:DUF169 domain-containing protein [Candidatus Omnitrophota bacterium]